MTVNLTRIYTKLGDGGETHLGDMSRVPKTHPRIEAYGDVDELNAQIGVTLTVDGLPAGYAAWLRRIQNDLFDVGADLAVPEPPDSDGDDDGAKPQRKRLRVTAEQVTWLEGACDEVNATLEPLRSFVLPGGTASAAQLHVCRTVCRRAERRALLVEGSNPEVVRYLNRLSDLLFILSRGANDGEEPLWEPGELAGLMDGEAIRALLARVAAPTKIAIPLPPNMSAIPVAGVVEAGGDPDEVEAWVRGVKGWPKRVPPMFAPPEATALDLMFYIVPDRELEAGRQAAGPSLADAGANLMAFIPTKNMEKARPFYEKVLGLELEGSSPFACAFRSNGVLLRVVAVEKLEPHPFTVLGWSVEDLTATVRGLAARGVTFDQIEGVEQDELGIWQAPGGAKVTWFKDPDGNTLSLTQF